MNKHLRLRIEALLARYESAIVATCGLAGPQVSHVAYRLIAAELILLFPRDCDHLFNLETQNELVLLSPEWELHGEGHILQDDAIEAVHRWQVCVRVRLMRFHILNGTGAGYAETIDFE